MKSLTQIVHCIADLHKVKNLHFNQVLPILEGFHQLKIKCSLIQRISIIGKISQLFQMTIANELSTIERFKFEVYYGFLDVSSKRERGTTIKNRKRHKRQVRRGAAQLTLNQILEQAVAEGLNQINNQSNLPVPKQDLSQDLSKIPVTIPPFEPEIIAQLNRNSNFVIKTPEKQLDLIEWEPNKLENYQKWLALTQNGINLSKIQRLPPTKKRNPPRKEFLKDEKIDISQEVNQLAMMQKLQTKLKFSRQLKQKKEKGFQTYLGQINPSLTNIQRLREKLSNKSDIIMRKRMNMLEKNLNDEDHLNAYNQNAFASPNVSKEKSLTDSSLKSDTLAEKLQRLLIQTLLREAKISFNQVCKSKVLAGESKGEIFHRLLHLNYRLEQTDVAQFGEIYISAKA